ncbi:MAG: ANTAR domain-containing protein [Clostridiales bacterium]|nr:ANTAR domain-containing protein [Clostridiales bacterium]
MIGIRVCLALNQIEEMKKIKQFLTHQGFSVIDESTDGAAALRNINMLHPDLVIADADLPGINGINLAKIMDEDDVAPVIVITNSNKEGLWMNSGQSQGITFLQRPLTKAGLMQTIQLSLMNYRKQKSLKDEIKKLKEQLEDRKLIEKAKGIIMDKLGVTEKEAYRLLQKQSMDTGTPLRELAKAIILTHQLNSQV